MRAAAIQLTATPDTAANLAAADGLVRRAAADGATLVLLPEKWSVLGHGARPARRRRAARRPGDHLGPRASRASCAIDLVAGSVAERVAGEEKLRNTSVHIGPDGEIRATYRKIHLFDVEVDGTVYRESENEVAGRRAGPQRRRGRHRAGAEHLLRRALPGALPRARRRGARILLVPAAFTLATTRDHWEMLLRARAIENQCFVVAANQIGEHEPGLRSGGRSMIVDPWGIVLAQAADQETVITADLDLAAPGRHPPPAAGARGPPPRGLRAARGSPPDGHAQRPAGRREAAPDPRRRRPRLRPPGLPHLPRVATSPTRRASPTASSTTTSAPRTRSSTRSSSSAGTSCSR